MSDFVIKNGVLIKYTGDEPEVVVPDGITEIKNEAFVLHILSDTHNFIIYHRNFNIINKYTRNN